MNDYTQWVRDGQIVDARYATGPGVHARGVVYGYADRPTLLLRKADGSTVSWIADLCQPTTGEDVDRFVAAMRPARSEYSIQYLAEEEQYWRAQYSELMTAVLTATGGLRGHARSAMPPEPPVGTRYSDADGSERWRREADGWHCGREGCRNCPAEWDEVWDRDVSVVRDWTRQLPGGEAG